MDSNKTANLPLDALGIQVMASGHLTLNLSEQVRWDEFPMYADRLLEAIQGQKRRATDGPDVRIWDVAVEGHSLRLVYDDYPNIVALESSDDGGDALLRRLCELLGPPA